MQVLLYFTKCSKYFHKYFGFIYYHDSMNNMIGGRKMGLRKTKVLLSMLLVVVFAVGTISGCTGTTGTAGSSTVINASESIIDENNMMGIIQELTSKKYDGRLAGTEGNELAAGYIADYFKKIGLESPKGLDNYMQYYEQPVINLKSAPTLSIIDKDGKTVSDFKYIDNFTLRSLSSSTENIDIKAPIYVLNSLNELTDTNKELKGKIILISWELRGETNNPSVISMAYSFGAAGTIGEYPTAAEYRNTGSQTVTPMIGPWLEKQYNPFINIDSNSFKQLKDAAARGDMVEYKCSFSMDKAKKVPNLIGILPGSDPKLKDKYIIISSHFDHVGDNHDGTYNPGALDNASGTAAMMEIARVLKNSKQPPQKSILFISFNGEEAGMLGSQYYAAYPVYPLKDSVMINLDMVGSSADLPLDIDNVGGPKLKNELMKYAEELGIEAEESSMGASDHVSLAHEGVPAVMLANDDMFNGYHSPGDTIEDVSAERIEQVVKLVLYYIDKNAY